ncbi:tyrosinase cofactor [Streptomyces sp. NPDC004065]|uniref:apotyrosinase chaperone MelC1 n=1 Tax=Streptomyces sp. NPDC004065 TaxID=3364689 RepID=UPI00384C2ECB
MPELSRRRALTVTAVLATAAAARTATAAPASAAAPRASVPAPRASAAAPRTSGAAPRDHRHHAAPEPFDEVYKGRRIQGRPADDGGHHHGMEGMPGMDYAVFVDGAPLHVMRNADGTWISVVSHYDPVESPRAAARAAVDELRGARLVPFPAG